MRIVSTQGTVEVNETSHYRDMYRCRQRIGSAGDTHQQSVARPAPLDINVSSMRPDMTWTPTRRSVAIPTYTYSRCRSLPITTVSASSRHAGKFFISSAARRGRPFVHPLTRPAIVHASTRRARPIVNKSVSVRSMAVLSTTVTTGKKTAGDLNWNTGNYISVQWIGT